MSMLDELDGTVESAPWADPVSIWVDGLTVATQVAIVTDPGTPPSVAAQLIQSLAVLERVLVASKVTHRQLLELLVDDSEPAVRRSVAHNRALPSALLARLADDTDSHIQAAVARHLSTSATTLNRLALTDSAPVQQELMLRQDVQWTPEAAAALINSSSVCVRDYLAFTGMEAELQQILA